MNAARTQVQMATGGLILDAIDARIEPKVTTDTPDDKPGWMHVNGAYLSQSADDGREGFSGFVTSVSVGWEYSEGSGYFAGFNWSDSEVDDGTELNIGGLHAGLYGAWESLEADYVLAVGLFNRGDTERPQANNAVVGGLETATAHQDIVLLTSALSWQGLLGQDHRLRLSYTGAYSESGEFRYQDNRLSIDRQDSHQLEVRSNWTHQLSDMSRLNYGLDLGKQESGDVDVSLFKGASELSIQGESSFYTRGFVGIQSGNGRLELSMDNNEHFEIIVNYNKRF